MVGQAAARDQIIEHIIGSNTCSGSSLEKLVKEKEDKEESE